MGLQDWTAWASGRCHARQILPGSDAEFLRTLLVFLSSGDQNPKKSNLQEELFWLMVLEIVAYSPWWGRTISWYGIWWKGCLSHGGQEIERDRNGPGMKYIPKGRAPPIPRIHFLQWGLNVSMTSPMAQPAGDKVVHTWACRACSICKIQQKHILDRDAKERATCTLKSPSIFAPILVLTLSE